MAHVASHKASPTSSWLTPAPLHLTLSVCPQALDAAACSGAPGGSMDSLLSMLAPAQGHGPCTNVWTAGTVAYRCRTCQVTATSAVCVACFKAGGHEGHDYILYRSPAGGCCDCGDLSSWALDGEVLPKVFGNGGMQMLQALCIKLSCSLCNFCCCS